MALSRDVRDLVRLALAGRDPAVWAGKLLSSHPPATRAAVVEAVLLALPEFQVAEPRDPEDVREVLNEEEVLALLVGKRVPRDVAELVLDAFLEATLKLDETSRNTSAQRAGTSPFRST